MLIKEGEICDILVPVGPKFPLEEPREHLHVQELFKEGLLISRGLILVTLEVEASLHAVDGALARRQVFLVVLKDADEEIEEAHSNLFYILRR